MEVIVFVILVAIFIVTPFFLVYWIFKFVRRKFKKTGDQETQYEFLAEEQARREDEEIKNVQLENGCRYEFPSGVNIEVTIDDFDGTKSLDITSIRGYGRDKFSTFIGTNNITFKISFNSRGDRNQILFGSYQKELKFNQGDKILFLFIDGSQEEFVLEKKGYKIDQDETGVEIESYAGITEDQAFKFANLEIKKYRILNGEDIKITWEMYEGDQNNLRAIATAYCYTLTNFYEEPKHSSIEDVVL